MSLVIGCDTGSLGLDDIFRLISGIDVDGNIYIRVCDGNAPAYIFDIACNDFGVSALDILRSALAVNDDGEFCLNVSASTVAPDVPVDIYCATYRTIYDDLAGLGTPPSDAIAAEQNTMVCGLVDDGVWAKLDVFYLFAQTTNAAGEALMNWVTSGLFNATAVNAPAFVALEGFTGDGASAYINTNWNANSDGVNYTLNSASFGPYVRTDVDETGYICGSRVTQLNILRLRSTNLLHLYHHTGILTDGANTDSRGFYVVNRDGSSSVDVYRNGSRIIEKTETAVAVPNVNTYVLCYNNNGTPTGFTTTQVSLFFAGSELTPTDITNFTNRVEVYMDSNGKGVIP